MNSRIIKRDVQYRNIIILPSWFITSEEQTHVEVHGYNGRMTLKPSTSGKRRNKYFHNYKIRSIFDDETKDHVKFILANESVKMFKMDVKNHFAYRAKESIMIENVTPKPIYELIGDSVKLEGRTYLIEIKALVVGKTHAVVDKVDEKLPSVMPSRMLSDNINSIDSYEKGFYIDELKADIAYNLKINPSKLQHVGMISVEKVEFQDEYNPYRSERVTDDNIAGKLIYLHQFNSNDWIKIKKSSPYKTTSIAKIKRELYKYL